MTNYDTKRAELVEELKDYGVKSESWETTAELKNKLFAARAMEVKEDRPGFGRF